MALPEYPRSIEGLEFTELAGLDEVICMDPVSTSSLALNATARALLELCDGAHSITDICQIISEATGADPAHVRGDVTAILDRFVAYGFVSGD